MFIICFQVKCFEDMQYKLINKIFNYLASLVWRMHMFILTHQTTDLTPQHLIRSSSDDHLQGKGKLYELTNFFALCLVEDWHLHIMCIPYFSKLYRSVQRTEPLSVFIRISPLITSWFSQASNNLQSTTFLAHSKELLYTVFTIQNVMSHT